MSKEGIRYSEHTLRREVNVEELAAACLDNGFAFALYRLPHADVSTMVIDLNGSARIDQPDIETLDPGFLFAPFDHTRHDTRYFHAHVLATIHNRSGEMRISPKLDSSTTAQLDSLMHSLESGNRHQSAWYTLPTGRSPVSTREDFMQLVDRAITGIRRGAFHKVVPSRMQSIMLREDFSHTTFFERLADRYPSAMVYLVSSPATGTWIGATPELLLSIDRRQVFSTSALAGTQPYREGFSLDDAAWRQKEIEEQAMVSRYIINCFKRIRLREFDETGPRTVKAGNLMHLETRYSVDMNEVQYPQLGTVMLKLLHPTSAICGMPKEPAMDFLQRHEAFDRTYFSGFLGPVHIDDEVRIYVNLRCMQLTEGHRGVLYSGAGVTEHSDPEKEWIETTLKMKTLGDLIAPGSGGG